MSSPTDPSPTGKTPRPAAGTKTRSRRTATVRGPRGRVERLRARTVAAWRALAEMPWVWTALTLGLGAWLLMPPGQLFVPRVDAGTIASRDYVASEDLELLDARATEQKRSRAREQVLPVYDYDPAVEEDLDAGIERLFAEGREMIARAAAGAAAGAETAATGAAAAPAAGDQGEAAGAAEAAEAADPLSRLRDLSGLVLDEPQLALLETKAFSADLEDRLRGVVSQALRRKVVANKTRLLDNPLRGITQRNLAGGDEASDFDPYDRLGYPDEVREFFESEVRSWPGLAARERRTVVELLLANLSPNLHRNRSETERRREEAATAAEPLYTRVRKGQVIVRKGDEVGPAEAQAIASLGGRSPLHRRLLPLLGTVILLALSVLVLRLGLQRERVADHSRERLLGESLLLLLLSLLGAKFGVVVAGALAASFETAPLDSSASYLLAVPFATLALLASLLLGRQAALILALVFSLLVSRLGGDPAAVVVYSLAGSLTAIYGLEHYQFKQRLVMMRLGLLVGAVNVAAALMLRALAGAAGEPGPALVAFDVVCAFAGGLLAAAVASFLVPVLESLLGITTDIKLIELANTNLPLLRRLAFEAPGTFQHSLMVANLAKVGCEAVGADSTLAYTGGLYHDIGKVLRPEYFVENQRPGHNRHDKLLPSMSALILINHVKEGVELAREHHLPQPIFDAIEQHHGTRLIKFFYNRALEQCDPETGSVREEKYRYPGPKPQHKVMGVLMLADAVEAASRTLNDPTPPRVRALIRTLVEDVLADGQLDHTDLTLADLRRVSEAFQRVLTNIFHRRIDYPGFDFNAPPRRERKPSAEAAIRAS